MFLKFIPIACLFFGAVQASPDLVSKNQNSIYLEDINKILKQVEMQQEYDEEKSVRLEFVKQEAYNFGVAHGAFNESKRIYETLERYSDLLYRGLNFSPFIVNGNILMPKVEIKAGQAEQIDKVTLRRVDASFKIVGKGELILQVPTWRDYIIRQYPEPVEITPALMPKNKTEKSAFDSEFKKGYLAGVKQALTIFDLDYTRLVNELVRLYNFRELAAQSILSIPTSIDNLRPVSISEDGTSLYLNDRTRQISEESKFNPLSEWQPIIQGGK